MQPFRCGRSKCVPVVALPRSAFVMQPEEQEREDRVVNLVRAHEKILRDHVLQQRRLAGAGLPHNVQMQKCVATPYNVQQ
jgi:hypothetical protein